MKKQLLWTFTDIFQKPSAGKLLSIKVLDKRKRTEESTAPSKENVKNLNKGGKNWLLQTKGKLQDFGQIM